jgi:hypothetical protein
MNVTEWLRNLGLERYASAFRENDVDAKLLPNLTADDLKDLGITSSVPLFIEELTKAILETAPDNPSLGRAVPNTLQALLFARLDRLPPAKQLAQIGAVIGREFSQNLLTAAAELSEAQLTKGLNELVAAGLMVRRVTARGSSTAGLAAIQPRTPG